MSHRSYSYHEITYRSVSYRSRTSRGVDPELIETHPASFRLSPSARRYNELLSSHETISSRPWSGSRTYATPNRPSYWGHELNNLHSLYDSDSSFEHSRHQTEDELEQLQIRLESLNAFQDVHRSAAPITRTKGYPFNSPSHWVPPSTGRIWQLPNSSGRENHAKSCCEPLGANYRRNCPQNTKSSKGESSAQNYCDGPATCYGEDYAESPKSSRRGSTIRSSRSSQYNNDYSRKERTHAESPSRPRASRKYSDRTNHTRYNDQIPSSQSSKYLADHRKERTRAEAPLSTVEKEFTDHYATFGISPNASASEIKKAAKQMRIETRPDRCKRPGMSEGEKAWIDKRSAKVGQAADVLIQRAQKYTYDRE